MAEPHPEAFREALASLSRFFVGDASVDETLDALAHTAVSALPGADVAGMSLWRDGELGTWAYTDPESPAVDRVQYETGHGPCLDAMRYGEVLVVDDTAEAEPRWPRFEQECARLGIRSTASLPLTAKDESIGGLNLYSHTAKAFPLDELQRARVFATSATAVAYNSLRYQEAVELGEGLTEAMASRATIEQAKGIVMARSGVDADAAFDVLVRASQRENRRLREIAAELVERTAAGARAPDAPAPAAAVEVPDDR